jgi:hypothetical protein
MLYLLTDKWLCLANSIMNSEPLVSDLLRFAVLCCLPCFYLFILQINLGRTKLIKIFKNCLYFTENMLSVCDKA